MAPHPAKAWILAQAADCGFELAGVAAALPLDAYSFYRQWVAEGSAGEMRYLTDHRAGLREDPRTLFPSARSIICVAKLYKTEEISVKEASGRGFISRYAWGSEDYHDILRRGLTLLVDRLEGGLGPFDSRICIDTAPLLERAYARAAGLGWIGKNTCLINQIQGSWFFLGFLLTSIEIAPDAPPPDRCGTCRRCIDACPTQAIVPGPGAPGPDWQLDGRLCISTLTIETRGPAPEETRPATGSHLFGCDICQEVCPWNRRAPSTLEPGFQPASVILDLEESAAMTPETFRERFRRTPVWRAKYAGWLRNVATAMGNSGNPDHRPTLERLAAHGDPAVAAHARWALERLG